jgi:hypothetical protein
VEIDTSPDEPLFSSSRIFMYHNNICRRDRPPVLEDRG